MAGEMVQFQVRGQESVLEMLAQKLSPTVRIAAASGMNRTAEEVLGHQSNRIQREFMVRVPRFILPPMKLPGVWKATPAKLHVLIALGDQQLGVNAQEDIGRRRVQILSKFGAAQQKVARDERNYPIAIPTPSLAPYKAMRIPQRMYPRQLVGRFSSEDGKFIGLSNTARHTLRRRKRKGETVTVSRQVGRYFVLGSPTSGRGWGLYERTRSGAGGVRMLWAFRRSVPIPKLLDFEVDASRIINERSARDFANAFDQAVLGRLR
jgi:hypothetical protein